MLDLDRIQLDFRKKEPLFEQLAYLLRREIALGMLQPGEQLPTVRVLADRLRINFNTVARAYRVLDMEGRISTQQGRGTYVTELPEREEMVMEDAVTVEQLVDQFLAQAIDSGIPLRTFQSELDQKINQRENDEMKPRQLRPMRSTRYRRLPAFHQRNPFPPQAVKQTIAVLRKRRK